MGHQGRRRGRRFRAPAGGFPPLSSPNGAVAISKFAAPNQLLLRFKQTFQHSHSISRFLLRFSDGLQSLLRCPQISRARFLLFVWVPTPSGAAGWVLCGTQGTRIRKMRVPRVNSIVIGFFFFLASRLLNSHSVNASSTELAFAKCEDPTFGTPTPNKPNRRIFFFHHKPRIFSMYVCMYMYIYIYIRMMGIS